MTTIVCWDLAQNVEYYQVRNILKDTSGVLDISFSSTRCCAVVRFATAIDAQMALYQLIGHCMEGHPLPFAWFDTNSCDLNKDTVPMMELVPGRIFRTVCVEGFDFSLSNTKIRSMLKSHLGLSRHGGRIFIPRNPNGTNTGKTFVCFHSHRDFVAALDLGDGRKLQVTRWLELLGFPWNQIKKEGSIVVGSVEDEGLVHPF